MFPETELAERSRGRDHTTSRSHGSRTRLLLLFLKERKERYSCHLHDLEPHTRNVADRMTTAPETGDKHLIVLIDEIEATVIRDKCSDLLAILDELSTAALADS